jgi:hypothetical protein
MKYENTHENIQHICDSSKINMSYGLLHNKITGPFSAEVTITGNIHHGMQQNIACSQLE